MLNWDKIENVFLVGIGGIGMSALARYFHFEDKSVAGYDKTSTVLTSELQNEGMTVIFEDDLALIPDKYKNSENTLVIYTPAIPSEHKGLCFFKEKRFTVLKRAEVLGLVTRNSKAICVAGTHGKTTTSSLIAHLMKQSLVDCNAFLGGIVQNYHTNLLLSDTSDFVVLEADEYDRSFLQLTPHMAVITSADADHLDIYGEREEVKEAFKEFAGKIQQGGTLLIKEGIDLSLELASGVTKYTYSLDNENSDFHAKDIELVDGYYRFTFVTPEIELSNLMLGIPGLVNVENAIAALTMAFLSEVRSDELKNALWSFKGIRRRFEYRVRSDEFVFIDDYAHHPEEIKATVKSVRAIYDDKKLTGIFQPHLYSRTKDFAKEFAESLSLLDELILLDIYPARELPIEGVSSEMIFKNVTIENKYLCTKKELPALVKKLQPQLLLTMGAGDIDKEVPLLEEVLIK